MRAQRVLPCRHTFIFMLVGLTALALSHPSSPGGQSALAGSPQCPDGSVPCADGSCPGAARKCPTPRPTPTPRRTPPPPQPRCVSRSPTGGTGNRRSVDLGGGVKLEMVEIPPGSFCMGSTNGDRTERPVHQVTLRHTFYIGIYEVKQAEWKALMNDNPARHPGDDLPVENVSWYEVQKFIDKLNAQDDGFVYRLPSEAEWEYAARAGTTGRYAGQLDALAWYVSNNASNDWPHPVGSKRPNAFGLFDTHGNVWEWCEDWYHDRYAGAPRDGSAWLSSNAPLRKIARGGSCNSNAYSCRSANRRGFKPENPQPDIGFRVVAVMKSG